jgi:hypothetical protein
MNPREKPGAYLVARAQEILRECWRRICDKAQAGPLPDLIGERLLADVRAALNSKTKSYRYVLPTQLVAKLADPALDCRCLQAARGGADAFDARTVAHKVIVPFDQANDNVLGGSSEPYVNNPLRVPEITEAHRPAQKNKADWDALCRVLAEAQARKEPEFTARVFRQALTEIHHRLAETKVTYPAPKRISLDACLRTMQDFLRESSGGDRLLALTSALFSVLGRRFRLFSRLKRANITAADASTGMLADLECLSETGEVVLAVEVKDRDLTITQFSKTMGDIRAREVSEIFFVAQGVAEADREMLGQQVTREFVSGHNVYLTDLLTLSRTALSLLGEGGRRDFLREVGSQLDQFCSDIMHWRAWARLLSSV